MSFRFVRLWLFSRTGSDSVLFPMFRFPSCRIGFGPLLIHPFFCFPLALQTTIHTGVADTSSVGRIVVGIVCRLVTEAGPEGRKRSHRICHGFVEGMNKTMGSLLVFRPLHKEGTNHVLTTHGPYLDNRFIATNQITGPVALWIRLAHTTFFPSEYQDGHDGPSRCRYFWFVVGCRSLNKAQETGIAKPSIAGLVVSVSILHSLGREGPSLLPILNDERAREKVVGCQGRKHSSAGGPSSRGGADGTDRSFQ